jgi:hypothetical protein
MSASTLAAFLVGFVVGVVVSVVMFFCIRVFFICRDEWKRMGTLK